MILDPSPNRDGVDARVVRTSIFILVLCVSFSTQASGCGDRDDEAQLQIRAELLYAAAAQGRWADAYALFLPRDKPDTPLDRFITLFSNHRPFKCFAVRIRHLHDDDDSVGVTGSQGEEKSVEVSMRLSVEYPDGRREILRNYSDLWVKSQGEWYFAANRRGPYE
jgi:hypothetical protein